MIAHISITPLANIGNEKGARCDGKFHIFVNKSHWEVFDTTRRTISLRNVIYENVETFDYEDGEVFFGVPTGRQYLDENGDIILVQEVTKDDHPSRLKYKLGPDKLLLSSVRLAKAPALHFEDIDFNKYVFSNGFYSISVKNGWDIRFVMYLFRCPQIKTALDNALYGGIGISTYKLEDLYRIRVPIVEKEEQLRFLKEIRPIETEITKLKTQKVDVPVIVNRVFRDYFHWDYNKFEELRKIKMFHKGFNVYGNNIDTRFSPKFHRPAADFVQQELQSRPHKKIKKCLKLLMITGQGVSPNDFDDNGEYAYISMADISSWSLNTEEINCVSDAYASEHLTKRPTGYHEDVSTVTKINDILMMRSGEGGIGKVAIVKDDLKAIFCDFIIRMRFDETIINPDFAYYYFRTDYIQYLIEVYKKGLGNNTNIFPNQVQEFLIPDIPLAEQKRIVDLIKMELGKQSVIEGQIRSKTKQIEKMMIKLLEN